MFITISTNVGYSLFLTYSVTNFCLNTVVKNTDITFFFDYRKSKLNNSLGETSKPLAILNIVLTVGFILAVSILAI